MFFRFAKLWILATLSIVAATGIFSIGTQANAYQVTNQPDIYVVMFRSDTCPPCKVVEPRLSQALSTLQDPRIEFVNIDTSGGHGDWNANAVFDRQIVPQYNKWLGITGFAAIIDADTKQTLGCINMSYNTDAMVMHIRNLKKLAVANETNFDFTCPEANNPV